MDMLEGIMTTRAMRRLSTEAVPVEDIETCLRAAQQAPSGGNIQPWQIVVVDDPEVKASFAELYRRCYMRYETALAPMVTPPRTPEGLATWKRGLDAAQHLADHLHEAPYLVVFCAADIDLTITDADGPLDIGSVLGSVFPAVQNFMLAARSLGLGTSLTTVFRIEQQATREILGVPERMQIVAMIPVGRPLGRFGVAARKPAEAITHWNHWGTKRPFSAGVVTRP
jgi:nitroreductase